MKRFFKDYAELCKHGLHFMKEHWLGNVIIYLITWGAAALYCRRRMNKMIDHSLDLSNYYAVKKEGE